MKEEFKHVVIFGKKFEYYSISNFGRLVSNKTGKYMKCNNKRGYDYVKLVVPKDFSPYEYRKQSKNNYYVDFPIDQLVMYAHKPIDEFPPKHLPKHLEHHWFSMDADASDLILLLS